MPTNTYTGPIGGDWFDPRNWSLATVPASGDTVDLFGANGPTTYDNVSAPPDPSSNALSGLLIDVSGDTYPNGAPIGIHDPVFNLQAGQLGTAAAPVIIDATADGATASDSLVSFTTLNGAVNVEAGQLLDIVANLDLFGPSDGVVINGNVDVAEGATLALVSGSGVPYVTIPPAPFTLNGQVTVDGGTLSVYSNDLGGTGSISISNGGTVVLSTSIGAKSVATLPVAFGAGDNNRLDLSGLLSPFAGVITGFGAGDVILSYDLLFIDDPLVAAYSDGVLTVADARQPQLQQRFDIAGNYSSVSFDLVQSGSTEFEILYAPCFATGTSIATAEGDCPVEQLVVGQTVHLHDGRTAAVTWIGHRRQWNGDVVRVRAGALGDATPVRDLIVSTDHGLYLDGVLVQAGLLVDDEAIVREHRDEVTFWHIELDRHAVLLAENAPAESYLDTGNRRQFSNCGLAYDPSCATSEPCADMVFAGERLRRIRRRLVALV